MATRTYRDLITASLRLLGIKAQGQKATGNEAEAALDVLNELLDSWNAYSGMLFGTTAAGITLNGSAAYPFVPTGKLLGAWYRTPNGEDIPLEILANTDYGDVRVKGNRATYPTAIYQDVATSTLRLYPIGASSGQLIVQYATPLKEVTLDTVENLPPAYRQALRYNLAVLLAPEYGKEAPPTIQVTAVASKSMIINANAMIPKMDFTSELAPFDINTGV